MGVSDTSKYKGGVSVANIKIINKSKFELPKYKTSGSAGMDLQANIDSPLILKPMQRVLVPTGIYMSIPEGYEGQIRPRSGLAINYGITVLNSPGTIDSDFIGELKVIVINLGEQDFTMNPGDRIAQIVFSKHEVGEFTLVETLEETDRGEGGFGSTGK